MFTNTNNVYEPNDYLASRNKKFFRGHSTTIHPLYEKEITNAVNSINFFLNYTILKKAYYKRLKHIYTVSAEKCFNDSSNNYTFAEATMCENLLISKDVALDKIKNFSQEVEVRIQDAWEKEVKYSEDNNANSKDFSIEKFEANHRRFLLKLHFLDRFYYYQLSKRLFIDSFENKN